MRYILDTNILLHYLRESDLSLLIDQQYNPLDYAEIDAFSQGKLKDRPLSISARNMGKNDLWIAATASILNATLLTTDLDFNHLHNVFLNLEYIKV